MGKLEDKILENVYKYETKHTIFEVIFRIVCTIILFFLAIMVGVNIYQILHAQKTLDILQLFQEDREVIRQYFGQIVEVLYYELPKVQILIFIFIILALGVFALIFVKNFGKIKRRAKAIRKYWKHHT